MRTKALIVAAALAAGLASSMAENVYSLNVVGYVTVTVPAGKWQLVANPLSTTNNSYKALLQTPPEGLEVYKRAGSAWLNAAVIDGAWDGPDFTIDPGEGMWVKAPASAAYVNTFVGEVVLNSTNAIPSGFAIRSSALPQAGAISTVLGYPAAEGDEVYLYNGNNYDSAAFLDGAWDPSEPAPKVAEAFWLMNAGTAKTWVRNFTVN